MKSAENFGTCRRINPTHAATREETMQRNIVLDDNESVIAQMMVFQKKSWWQRVPGLLWLTQQRMFLLEHYAFRKDLILEIPRDCIRSITCEPDTPNKRVVLEYFDGDKVCSLNLHSSFPLRGDRGDEIAELLKRFQSGTFSSQ